MKQEFPEQAPKFYKRNGFKAFASLSGLILFCFFDVIFLGRTVTSLQVPGIMGNGPYGYAHEFSYQGLVDPGGSTWGPRPHTVVVSKMYEESHWPLWIPTMGTGQPLAANMDSNALNPLRLFLYVDPSAYAWDLYLLARLLLAGLFTFWFMQSLRLSFGGSLFAAMLFMFSGYFMFSIDMHHLDVEIFLPLVFLCIEKLIQRERTLLWGMLGSLSIFQTVVGGHPQGSFLILSFGVVYSLFRILVFPENRSLRIAIRHALTLGLVALVGIAAASFLLFPFYEFMLLSTNNHTAGSLGLTYNSHVSDIIAFFVPYFFGLVYQGWFEGYSWHLLTRGYVGITAVVFALTAFFMAWKTKDRQRPFIFFFFLSLVLMLAKFYGFPQVNWIGRLPVAKMVNFGKYLGPLYAFCFAILAGFCLDRMSRSDDFLERVKKPLLIILFLSTAAFSYHYHSFTNTPSRDFVLLQMGLAALPVGAVAVVYWLYAKGKIFQAGTFKFIVGLIALIELVVYMPNLGLTKHRNYRYDIFAKAPYIDFLKKNIQNHRVIGEDGILYPDFSSAFGIGDLRVLDALLVNRYMKFIGTFFPLPNPPDRFTADEKIDFSDPGVKRALDLLGVKYILRNKDHAEQNSLISDIATNGKAILFPDGGPKTQWINASKLTINDSTKPILFEHPPSRIEYPLTIPEKSSMNFSIGMVPGSWSPEKGDGVLFEILLEEGGSIKTIFSKYIDPKTNAQHRKWFDESLDLGAYGGKKATLTFVTLPGLNGGTNSQYDWSAWGDLKIENQNARGKVTSTEVLVYDSEVKISENPTVFPRAFVVHDFKEMNGEKEILAALKSQELDLHQTVIIEGDVSPEIRAKLSGLPGTDASAAQIAAYDDQTVEISATMQNPGFLVLSDTYYPGWQAYVDGAPTKIFQTDYLLRSVFLERGVHNVKFVYEPKSFKLGLTVSIGTLLSSGGFLLVIWISGKRRKSPAEIAA